MTVVMPNRWRALLTLSLILAVGANAIASLDPRLRLPGVGDGFDLGFHGAAYGTLLILGGILQRRLRWVAVAVLGYATLLEGLQYFVSGREVHLSDQAANVGGILAGLAIVALWRGRQGGWELEDTAL